MKRQYFYYYSEFRSILIKDTVSRFLKINFPKNDLAVSEGHEKVENTFSTEPMVTCGKLSNNILLPKHCFMRYNNSMHRDLNQWNLCYLSFYCLNSSAVKEKKGFSSISWLRGGRYVYILRTIHWYHNKKFS